MSSYPLGLRPSLTAGAAIYQAGPSIWRLALPAGDARHYRLAQLDDYSHLPRRAFLHQAPVTLSLRARACNQEIPGTWGFGLWNDPFSMGLLAGNRMPRLPTLPNTIWFFFASAPNYLSLRDDLPARGGLAAAFHTPAWARRLLPVGILSLPLLALPPGRRLLRRLARRIILQQAVELATDPTEWHNYRLEWKPDAASFQVDGRILLETRLAPSGRLGLVIWIDNQYLSFTPDGRIRYGVLPCSEPAWIEISDLAVRQG